MSRLEHQAGIIAAGASRDPSATIEILLPILSIILLSERSRWGSQVFPGFPPADPQLPKKPLWLPGASVILQIHRDAIARRRRAVAQGVQLPQLQRPEDHRQD
jgi:hypothetical protein